MFCLWPEGDQDHPAHVAIPYDNPKADGPEMDELLERAAHIRSALKTAFSAIWDVREWEIRFLTDLSGNDAWMEGATVFNVWHDGDSSVGIYGESAEVAIRPDDPGVEMGIDDIKGALRKAFTDIWGGWRTHVATSAELEPAGSSTDDTDGPR